MCPDPTQTTKRWFPASSDPPQLSSIEERFRDALAVEYASEWPFYNQETRERLGDEAVRLNINPVMRAIARSGLQLVEAVSG